MKEGPGKRYGVNISGQGPVWENICVPGSKHTGGRSPALCLPVSLATLAHWPHGQGGCGFRNGENVLAQ